MSFPVRTINEVATAVAAAASAREHVAQARAALAEAREVLAFARRLTPALDAVARQWPPQRSRTAG